MRPVRTWVIWSATALGTATADAQQLRGTVRDSATGQRMPGGIDFQQFRSNLVTRWEYRPGSVVFFVWTQGRDFSAPQASTLRLGQAARDLVDLAPRNTIAVKASYW